MFPLMLMLMSRVFSLAYDYACTYACAYAYALVRTIIRRTTDTLKSSTDIFEVLNVTANYDLGRKSS